MHVASNPPTKVQKKISKTLFRSPSCEVRCLLSAFHYSHFTDEVIKAQQNWESCPWSQG